METPRRTEALEREPKPSLATAANYSAQLLKANRAISRMQTLGMFQGRKAIDRARAAQYVLCSGQSCAWHATEPEFVVANCLTVFCM